MKKMKSVLAVVLAATMCVGLAAGCTPTDSKDSGETSGGSTAEEPVTIKFQTWNPGEGPAIKEVIAAFEKENPGIKVEYVYMPYTDHVEKLKVDLASGEGADVYGMQTGATIQEFRDFEMDLTDYAVTSWGDDWKSKFQDFCMDLLNEDGHYYAMPLGLTYAGLAWADVNMLEEYGTEVPRSMKELKECTKILRENNQYPLTIGAKDAWINIDTWMSIANDINSEKLYQAIEGDIPFTDADLVESFAIWQSLFKDGIFQDGALGVGVYNDTSDLFQKEGSIPMILNGSWAGGVYVSGDPDEDKVFNSEGANHEAFLIDWNDDGKTAPVTASVDVCLCMNKNTKNPEAAWKFIDFMVNEGQDILVNGYFSYCPSRTDLELDVKGMNDNGKKNLDYILEQAQNNLAGYREMKYPELKQTIADTLTSLALGDVTPEAAAKTVEAASQAQAR